MKKLKNAGITVVVILTASMIGVIGYTSYDMSHEELNHMNSRAYPSYEK